MKDQSNRDLDELIQEVVERDAKRIPLRINRQTVVLVVERNFNAEYRRKKALQFGETMDDGRSAKRGAVGQTAHRCVDGPFDAAAQNRGTRK